MQTLTFQNTTLTPVSYNDAQIWLSSSDLAKALGYADVRSIANIYNRNKEEFTSGMTKVINLITSEKSANLQTSTRIFNLRGCHLIAMFARTAVAKAFRKWVLDILDKEVGAPVQRHTISIEQQAQIQKAVKAKCQSNKLHYQALYHHLYDKFGVKSYKDILAVDFERALAFVYDYAFCHNRNVNIALNYTSDSVYQNIKSQEQIDNILILLQSLVNSIGEMQARLKKQDHLLRSSQQLLK